MYVRAECGDLCLAQTCIVKKLVDDNSREIGVRVEHLRKNVAALIKGSIRKEDTILTEGNTKTIPRTLAGTTRLIVLKLVLYVRPYSICLSDLRSGEIAVVKIQSGDSENTLERTWPLAL